MPGYVIDLQNAFMQSDKLEREAGTLYAKPPVGVGLPGVDSEQLIEIKAGVYGLGDASRHWRNSLIPELEKLGYIKSKLAPTTFRLHNDSGQLQGLIVVEIDDLFTVGHEEHKARLDQLSKRFKVRQVQIHSRRFRRNVVQRQTYSTEARLRLRG